MNRKRILSGGLLAGIVYLGLDYVINDVLLKSAWHEALASGYIKTLQPHTLPVITLIDLGIGFVLMWLYASARPRMGPGPKTALRMGTLAWFLLYVPAASAQWLWYQLPSNIPATYLVAGLLQCWISIYLAGWQYIEKAP